MRLLPRPVLGGLVAMTGSGSDSDWGARCCAGRGILRPSPKTPPMTETVTIPAHIENGELRLDGPLPENVASVEVRVQVKSAEGRPEAITKLLAFIRALPPGTRTQEEVDAEIDEGRGKRRVGFRP